MSNRRRKPPSIEWPADQVKRWPIGKLLPYARNMRTHSAAQVAQIAASIREWGWTMPVLVDEAGTLIAGHGRVLAAHVLEIETIPTMIAKGWSDAQIKAYRIADNQLALVAGWDDELLGIELSEIQEGGFDVGLVGLTPEDVERLLAGPKPPAEFGAHDETISTSHECPKCGFKWSGAAGQGEPENVDDAVSSS